MQEEKFKIIVERNKTNNDGGKRGSFRQSNWKRSKPLSNRIAVAIHVQLYNM